MATVTISVSDELLREARERLGGNHEDVEAFLRSALHDLADDKPVGPDTDAPLDPATATALIEVLNSPLVDLPDGYWQETVIQLEARHGRPPAGDGGR